MGSARSAVRGPDAAPKIPRGIPAGRSASERLRPGLVIWVCIRIGVICAPIRSWRFGTLCRLDCAAWESHPIRGGQSGARRRPNALPSLVGVRCCRSNSRGCRSGPCWQELPRTVSRKPPPPPSRVTEITHNLGHRDRLLKTFTTCRFRGARRRDTAVARSKLDEPAGAPGRLPPTVTFEHRQGGHFCWS